MPAEYGAQFPLNIASGELILLEHGGHGNFLNTDWFRDLLRAKFSQVPVACRLSQTEIKFLIFVIALNSILLPQKFYNRIEEFAVMYLFLVLICNLNLIA